MGEKQTMGRSTDEVMAAVQAKRKAELSDESMSQIDAIRFAAICSLEPGEMITDFKPVYPGQQTVTSVTIRRGNTEYVVGIDRRELEWPIRLQKLLDIVGSRFVEMRKAEGGKVCINPQDDTPAPLPTDEQIASLLKENERLQSQNKALRLALAEMF